jgi:hypothetical protein
VDLSIRLPKKFTRITGVHCKHTYGIEYLVPAIAAPVLPRIGWFYIEANNRKNPIGVFDVGYTKGNVEATNGYQEIDIPVQPGSIISGIYNNELIYNYGEAPQQNKGTASTQFVIDSGDFIKQIDPGTLLLVDPATAPNYAGYLVSVYLKCLAENL